MSSQLPDAMALLYSFPYWLLVDTEAAPSIREIIVNGVTLRFYPLFRSGLANFIPMPPIDPYAIPFPSGMSPSLPSGINLPTLAAIPHLELDVHGKASMTLQNSPEWDKRPKIFPMDSMRVDVWGDNSNTAYDLALGEVRKLLQLLRCGSRQWWIEHTVAAGELRNVLPINRDGSLGGVGSSSRVLGGTVRGDERAIDEALWQKSLTDLENGVTAPLYDLLVLDAQFWGVNNEDRRAVLDAAIACEQARDTHLERLWNAKATGIPYKASRVITGNNLPNHLSSDMERFIARSYEKEHPSEFAIVKELWDARGNIAHGRPNQYVGTDGKLTLIDIEKVKEFIKTAEHCLRWLESL